MNDFFYLIRMSISSLRQRVIEQTEGRMDGLTEFLGLEREGEMRRPSLRRKLGRRGHEQSYTFARRSSFPVHNREWWPTPPEILPATLGGRAIQI